LAHHCLGMALFELQKFDEAAQEFREVLRLAPGAANHYDLAACLMTMGLYGQALAELETAARMAPGQQLYGVRKQELIRLINTQAAR
jgi:tetratricopeptide (TPR) repeat protein